MVLKLQFHLLPGILARLIETSDVHFKSLRAEAPYPRKGSAMRRFQSALSQVCRSDRNCLESDGFGPDGAVPETTQD